METLKLFEYLCEQQPDLIDPQRELFLVNVFDLRELSLDKPSFYCTSISHVAYLEDKELSCLQEYPPSLEQVLIVASRSRDLNYAHLARAYDSLQNGGVVVCLAANDLGAKSLEKQVRSHVSSLSSLSKFHARAFWFHKDDAAPEQAFEEWLTLWEGRSDPQFDLRSYPGDFSWRGVDIGSRLLSEFLPENIEGSVADFGAGNGFLSSWLLRNCSSMQKLDLYELEFHSLRAARENLTSVLEATESRVEPQLEFYWWDLSRQVPRDQYDCIVSNPPHHRGEETDISLGKTILKVASQCLKPNGSFYLVANLSLPYEAVLEENFSNFEALHSAKGYKVIHAQK